MADPATAMAAAQTVFSVGAAYQEGKAAEMAAKYEAKQLEEAAADRIATGTYEAAEEKRIMEKNLSDMQAQMAAGGGTTTSAGSVEQLVKAEMIGKSNAVTAMYNRKKEAYDLHRKAQARRWEGKMAKKAAIARGLAGAAGAAGSYFGRGSDTQPARTPLSEGSGYGNNLSYNQLPRSRRVGAGGRLPGESF